MNAKHTMFRSGIIRDEKNNKIVAFFDRETNNLLIDGQFGAIKVVDESHAMDVVAEQLSEKS